MHHLLALPLARCLPTLALSLALLGLVACGDLASALPARPSPVPTLARLPSVTPVTPSPTRPPTVTPNTTPSASRFVATVTVAANVRSGPGVNFVVVGGLNAGAVVSLLHQSKGWFEITGPDGIAGWMSEQVLELDPATAAAVPLASASP